MGTVFWTALATVTGAARLGAVCAVCVVQALANSVSASEADRIGKRVRELVISDSVRFSFWNDCHSAQSIRRAKYRRATDSLRAGRTCRGACRRIIPAPDNVARP